MTVNQVAALALVAALAEAKPKVLSAAISNLRSAAATAPTASSSDPFVQRLGNLTAEQFTSRLARGLGGPFGEHS